MPKLSRWQQALFQFIFFLVALFVLLPLWQTIYLAFEGGIHGRPTTLVWLPKEFTLDIFLQMWGHAGQNLTFPQALANSRSFHLVRLFSPLFWAQAWHTLLPASAFRAEKPVFLLCFSAQCCRPLP